MRSNAPVEHCVAERLSQWGDSSATETSRILIYLPLVEALGFPHLDEKAIKRPIKSHTNTTCKICPSRGFSKCRICRWIKQWTVLISRNGHKWSQMVTSRCMITIITLCKSRIRGLFMSRFFYDPSPWLRHHGCATDFNKTLAQRKKYVTIGSYERQI